MMAEPPESPVTTAVHSLEVRWIFPGQLEAAVARWFGRFPAETESRQDIYLLEAWHKWSFAFSPASPGSGGPPGWTPVHKKRRISQFSSVGGQIVARAPGLGQQPRCEVELTEVRTRGQHWWTLGFEATGPAHLLRSELQATAALVFDQALPSGPQPGTDQSRSYAQWLGQRPGVGPTGNARSGLPHRGCHISCCKKRGVGWAFPVSSAPSRSGTGHARHGRDRSNTNL